MGTDLQCPLCGGAAAAPFWRAANSSDYFRCAACDLVFLEPNARLSAAEEKAQYQKHNNDTRDPRYQEFVRPLVEEIEKRFLPAAAVLDFGAGEGPIVSEQLALRGFSATAYDPFFWPDARALEKTYDCIAASEVFEHLFSPGFELRRLRSCLSGEGAMLCVMTLLLEADQDFPSWFYRRDPTHVCFFSRECLTWVQRHFGFSSLEIIGKRIALFRV